MEVSLWKHKGQVCVLTERLERNVCPPLRQPSYLYGREGATVPGRDHLSNSAFLPSSSGTIPHYLSWLTFSSSLKPLRWIAYRSLFESLTTRPPFSSAEFRPIDFPIGYTEGRNVSKSLYQTKKPIVLSVDIRYDLIQFMIYSTMFQPSLPLLRLPQNVNLIPVRAKIDSYTNHKSSEIIK
jgi:hypothetical protein